MNSFSSIFSLNWTPSNPGAICFLILYKNSFKNKALKFTINPPSKWDSALLVEKINLSFFPFKSLIPLNPRIHSSKLLSVLDLYVIISLSIFIIPYLSGNPDVDSTDIDKLKGSISPTKLVDSDTVLILSIFAYWSILFSMSDGPPGISKDL